MSLDRWGWHFPRRLVLSGTFRPDWLYNFSSRQRPSLKRASRRPNSDRSCWPLPGWPNFGGPDSGRRWSNCSWATSCGWSFFYQLSWDWSCRRVIWSLNAKLLGQRLEGPVIFDVAPLARPGRTECARRTSCRERTPAERNKGRAEAGAREGKNCWLREPRRSRSMACIWRRVACRLCTRSSRSGFMPEVYLYRYTHATTKKTTLSHD